MKKVELVKPKDATVRLVNGRPQVVAAVNGTGIAADDLKKSVEPALTAKGDERTVGGADRREGQVLHRGRASWASKR